MWCTERKVKVLRLSKGVVKRSEGSAVGQWRGVILGVQWRVHKGIIIIIIIIII